MVRGKDMFDRIVTNVGNFIAMQRSNHLESPCVSLWLTRLRETLAQLESFIRLAHRLGVMEVYLQRMVGISPRVRAWQGLSRHCLNTPRSRKKKLFNEPKRLPGNSA